MNKIGKLKNIMYKVAFWVMFYSVFIRSFWLSTMIPNSVDVMLFVFPIVAYLSAFLIVGFIFYETFCSFKKGKPSLTGIISIVAISIFMLLSIIEVIPFDLPFMVILMVGASLLSTRDLLRQYVVSSTVCLTFAMILGAVGAVPNLIYSVEGWSRVSFGTIYPTDFCAHVFFIAMSYIYLKGNKIDFKAIMCLGLFGVFVICLCRARNTALCLFIAMLLIGIYIGVNKYHKELLDRKPVKVLGAFAIAFAPILALLMIVLSLLYKHKAPGNIPYKLDSLLSRRLMLGRIAFDNYSVMPFGQTIKVMANGEKVDDYLIPNFVYPNFVDIAIIGAVIVFIALIVLMIARKVRKPVLFGSSFVLVVICLVLRKILATTINVDKSLLTFEERILNGMYFFLDCSYISILFNLGWVVLAVVLILYVAISYKQFTGKEWVRLIVLAVVALQCMFEHHLLDLAYCPFFLCLLTKNDENIVDSGEVKNGHKVSCSNA